MFQKMMAVNQEFIQSQIKAQRDNERENIQRNVLQDLNQTEEIR